jgi:hypothetical protein
MDKTKGIICIYRGRVPRAPPANSGHDGKQKMLQNKRFYSWLCQE